MGREKAYISRLWGKKKRGKSQGLLTTACLLLVLLWPAAACLQPQPGYAVIDQISIVGNRKTQGKIILRELTFAPGDTILLSDLSEHLRQSENMVMNTSLFTGAGITFKNWEGTTNRVHILIDVQEAWYLYPVPVFELADRNFNVWWVEQNRSLQRVNFGLEFAHLNFSGHMDRLKVKAKYGYTRQYSISYGLPYINRANTLGLSANMSFARNREVNYLTVDNRQEFFKDENRFVYQRFQAETALTYRPGLQFYHNFIVRYNQNRINAQVANELNPGFFLGGRDLQRFFTLIYMMTFDSRDIRPYPLSGNYLQFILEKDGIGVFDDRNALTLFANFDQFVPLSDRWSLGLSTGMKLSLIRTQQPYNDYQAIGFGRSFLHGYEYYVIDGLDMGYLKGDLRFQIFNDQLNFGKLVPIEAFRTMPLKLYLSLHNDFGWANDPFLRETNFLNNRLLWGGGLGLDLVLYYDKVISLEYSFNHLLENGLFLHLNMNI